MRIHMTRRECLGVLAATALGPGAVSAQMAQTAPTRPAGKATEYPFYAFDNGLNGGDAKTIEDKIKLLADLGYAGVSLHLDVKQLPAWLEQLDKRKLELFAIYCVPFLEEVTDARLNEAVALVKGRRTRIELAFRSRLLKPSDPAGDAKAIDHAKRISDWCGTSGPAASIYPHAGFWTARAEDGLRLAKAVNRKNFGTNFNLVHWKWTGSDKPLPELLSDLKVHLLSVTVNGLQSAAAGQKDKIVPLDQGDFDVPAFVATVSKSGYRGPVGLQCWSIQGPSRAHLQASMAKWREIRKSLKL